MINQISRDTDTTVATSTEHNARIAQLALSGRFDGYHSKKLEESLSVRIREQPAFLILDMQDVNYISSAGLRVLIDASQRLKRAGGTVILADVQPYCREIIEMTGFDRIFSMYPDVEAALIHCRGLLSEKASIANIRDAEAVNFRSGQMAFLPKSENSATACLLGDIRDVLHSTITMADVLPKQFAGAGYSLGFGALGGRLEESFPIMGTMMSIGSTVVWLPSDSHGTPDFLMAKSRASRAVVQTPFNLAISGDFNEILLFESSDGQGVKMIDLYREMSQFAKKRKPCYKGAIGMTMLAEMKTAHGFNLTRAPVFEHAPANGKTIMHPSNARDWIACDAAPKYRDVVALTCGIGLNLLDDLSDYDENVLNSAFYLHPENTGGKRELFHNHALMIGEIKLPRMPFNLEREIDAAVGNGALLGMRHLAEDSMIRKAVIGVSYIQYFHRDPASERSNAPTAKAKVASETALRSYRDFTAPTPRGGNLEGTG